MAITMKSLSLKLDENLFEETELLIGHINIPRNRYINEAIEQYNKVQRKKIIAAQLKKESQSVSHESMKVLSEFEAFEDDEAI